MIELFFASSFLVLSSRTWRYVNTEHEAVEREEEKAEKLCDSQMACQCSDDEAS